MYAVGGYGSADETLVKKFESVLGGDRYNHAPKDWREVSEKEFAQSKFFSYTPSAIEFRQIMYDFDGNKIEDMLSVHLYLFHDGTGVAMAGDYWKGKVRYFKFGCEHDYKEYSAKYAIDHNLPYESGRCMHNTICEKCGNVWCYDSSD